MTLQCHRYHLHEVQDTTRFLPPRQPLKLPPTRPTAVACACPPYTPGPSEQRRASTVPPVKGRHSGPRPVWCRAHRLSPWVFNAHADRCGKDSGSPCTTAHRASSVCSWQFWRLASTWRSVQTTGLERRDAACRAHLWLCYLLLCVWPHTSVPLRPLLWNRNTTGPVHASLTGTDSALVKHWVISAPMLRRIAGSERGTLEGGGRPDTGV
ncbi:hypothetical protein HJG60_010708 [Phyllostomus discolor]|uniref:Uncharacterized protein n=1 Tax=Phyllostomus discolor TaxID=89673 RepID=A0A834APD3_9CHIR|nr:hypothetical protein HJG60_010708 [Phyllostomus discolor]